MTLEELKVIISAETKPFRDELTKMQSQMKSVTNAVTSQTSKIKSVLTKLGQAVAGLAIGRFLINVSKTAINTASDIQEVQNVVDTAFGSMSWKAEQFAKTAITQFGMSELSAKRTASTYMAMAKGMDLGNDVASDMAITLAGLTGDVASFYNISQELADTKLKSVFTGETETLKDLGIVMTQTNLQSYALSQGINKNVSDMTQAELTTLRYNYVLGQLSMAQGDFAKTSSSWANQIRILQEQWKQLLGIIGNGLISVLTPVIRILNTIISKIITFANVLSAVFGKLFGNKQSTSANAFSAVSNAVDSGTEALGGYSDALDNTGSQAQKTAKEIEGSLAGFDELNVIKTSSDSGTGGSGANTGGVGDTGYAIDPIDWDSAFAEPDTSGIDAAVDKVMAKINLLKNFLEKNKVSIIAALSGLTAGLLTFFGYKWLKGIGGFDGILNDVLKIPFVNKVIDAFLSIFISVPGKISGVFSKVVAVIKGSAVYDVLSSVFSPIVSFFSGVFSSISAVIGSGLSLIGGLFSKWLGVITGVVGSIAEAVMNLPVIGPVLETIIGVISKLITGLSTVFGWIGKVLEVIVGSPALLATVTALIVAALAQLWMTSDEFRNNVLLALENIKIVLSGLWENIIKPIFEMIVDICASVWVNGLQPLWEAWVYLVEIISGVVLNLWNNISPIINDVLELIGPIFQDVLNITGNIVSTIFNGILAVIQTVMLVAGDAVNGFFSTVDEVFSGIKTIFDGVITFISGIFTGNWRQAWQGVVDIFSGIFNGIAGVVKAPINAVIGIVNGAVSRINGFGFDVPDWVPAIGGKSFRVSVPTIPYLATGGIVDSATLAMIGEKGDEAIIPLKNNTQGLAMIADKLLENMPINNGGGTYVIQLVLEDGTVLAKKIIKNIKDYEIITGKPAF